METIAVFPPAFATFIYLNEDGEVVIRQENHNGDSLVIVPCEPLPKLVKALRGFILR